MAAMTVESGHTYRLVHARTGTVLDLSMKDWRSVSSSTWDASDNQKWVAERTSHGWTLRSVATGLFLGADGIPRPGAPVVGTREEAAWDLQSRGPSVHRIAVTGTRLSVQVDARVGVKLGEARDGDEWRLEQA